MADDRAREHALVQQTPVITPESATLLLVVDMTLDDEGNPMLLDWKDANVVVRFELPEGIIAPPPQGS